MSLPHFFLDTQIIAHESDEVFTLELTDSDARHARVLRLDAGEHLAVIDAEKDYFECEIVSFAENLPRVRIAQKLQATTPSFSVTLFQGLAKGDKMDEVLRHTTEIGIDAYVPLVCERSVVRLEEKKAAKRVERWRSIAKSAAMQSGRLAIPRVGELTNFQQACECLSEFSCVCVFWEEAPMTRCVHDALRELCLSQPDNREAVCYKTGDTEAKKCACCTETQKRVAIIVGPEGGLTQKEIDALLASNVHAHLVSLGPGILRTETAGVVACALVLYELGGLGNCYAEEARA